MKKILLLLLMLVVGIAAQATLQTGIRIQGFTRTNGTQTQSAGMISSIWYTQQLPVQSGSSYTFNNQSVPGDVTVTLNGTINFQEAAALTDVVTSSSFTVTLESSSTSNPYWFYGATVKTGSGATVSGCAATVSSNRRTLTVTIPSGKTFGYIYIDYVTNEPLSSGNTTLSGIDASYIYKGSAIEPVPTVTYYGSTLTAGTDYTVSYTGSNSPGTATVTVTGVGDYAGTVSKSYTIRNIALSDFNSLGNNTYEIATTDDLDRLAMLVNIAENTCSGITFKQTADIAYSTAGLGDTDANFTAIGGYFNGSDKNFSGTYDGQGHTISGIRLYKPLTNQNVNKNQALFGRAVNATIKNVTITDARITGYRIVAGLVGNCNGSTVQNCLVLNSTITCGDTYVGAVIGQNNNGTFTANYYRGCTVNGTAGATNVGVGSNGSVSSSSDRNGVRSVHTLTLPDGVTASGESVTIGGVTYYAANTTVTLVYNGTPPNNTCFDHFTVDGVPIDGDTFTIPAADIEIGVEFQMRYIFNSQTGALTLVWGEFNKDYKWGTDVQASAVTSVTATSDVRFTGNCSMLFMNFTNCTSMDLSKVSTDSCTNMGSMFSDCQNLASLNLSGWNTANVTNMNSMFYNCSSLDTLDVSHFDTGNVTNMGTMFGSCRNLTSLDLSGWNTGNVTNMSAMFNSCGNLASLDLSGWNTGNVTDMSVMFSSCGNLASLDLSGWDTGNVTNMDAMFYGCSSLSTLDLSHFDTGKVFVMQTMFQQCTGLETLDLSGWDTGKVNSMNRMFNGCTGLETLDLSGWNTGYVTDMHAMFQNCTSLTTIYVGAGWSTENVGISNDMFNGCTKLMGSMGTRYNSSHIDKEYAHIDGGASNPGYLSDPNVSPRYTFDPETGELALLWGEFNKDYKWGSEVTASAVKSVTATSEVSFTGKCDKLFNQFTHCESMDLSNVNTAGMTGAYMLFASSPSLTSLNLSGWNTGNITSMRYMFAGCSGLTMLDLSGWNTSNVIGMSYMFYGCSGLTSLDLSGWNTANVTDMNYMFYNCSSLDTLDLAGWNTGNVTDMSDMFYGCSNLTTINAGSGWSTENVQISNDMFYGCTNLVGGMGTAYDANHVDKEYARIDGGTENPGYFTEKPAFVPGDANGDGKVDVQDITAIINYILGNNPSPFNVEAADVNHTGDVNVMDVTAIINIILGIG
ncbi:MAG: BspA family leucine-rich repeat surface protein [Muribaculaceae bacterium]|nr:BspA family leucine-rich repeat surface protein [Muribaculaceae bacterium]